MSKRKVFTEAPTAEFVYLFRRLTKFGGELMKNLSHIIVSGT